VVELRFLDLLPLVVFPVGGYLLAMPIYEFHCEKCGKDNEVLVRSSDWKGTLCPSCGSTRLQKKLSVFASSTASTSGGDSAPACSLGGGGCGSCCGGGPHRH